MQKSKTLTLFAILFLGLQFIVWYGVKFEHNGKMNVIWAGTKSVKPELEVVPAVPSREMLKAFAFGDEEITFRYYGYIMQFLGDSFGRVTPLKDYNYDRLYRWWMLLDEVDPDSDLLAYVVGYYYAATQDPLHDIPYMVDFLESHSDKNPSKNWWWYYQASYNAKYKLKDNARALELAKKLADLPKDVDMPIWGRQLQAFIYEGQGEYKQACDVIVNVIRDYGDDKISEGEMNFMYSFIQDRLRKMIEKEATINTADISPECREMMKVQKAQDLKAKALGLHVK